MISASNYADALIASLKAQSASTFNDLNLTKNDFGLLDTTTGGSVFMILPAGFTAEIGAFGDRQYPDYELQVRCYVRDTGDSTTTLNRIWKAESDLRTAILADDTLGGSAMLAVVTRGTGWNGDTFVQMGDVVWLPQDLIVRIQNIG